MEAIARPTRRWTRAEYDRLIADGYFQPGEHLELVNGEIVSISPQGGKHAKAVYAVQAALASIQGVVKAHLRLQTPLALGGASAPEPDAALVAGSFRDYDDHPTSALLVVEVSDTTLGYDRRIKGPLYASAGIPEYWIVDVNGQALEVYREPVETPEGWIYRLIERLSPGDKVTPMAAPNAAIAVADLLP
jgi:Uma2 family endonuclease